MNFVNSFVIYQYSRYIHLSFHLYKTPSFKNDSLDPSVLICTIKDDELVDVVSYGVQHQTRDVIVHEKQQNSVVSLSCHYW